MIVPSWTRVRRILTSRPAWLALGMLVTLLLVVGANHPKPSSPSDRIDYLESVLKCPGCATASLAQSDILSANELKATISKWVHEGIDNKTIEQRVVADFGTNELLSQSNPLLWIIPSAVVGLGIVVLITFLVRRRTLTTRVTAADEALVAELLGSTGRPR